MAVLSLMITSAWVRVSGSTKTFCILSVTAHQCIVPGSILFCDDGSLMVRIALSHHCPFFPYSRLLVEHILCPLFTSYQIIGEQCCDNLNTLISYPMMVANPHSFHPTLTASCTRAQTLHALCVWHCSRMQPIIAAAEQGNDDIKTKWKPHFAAQKLRQTQL